MKKFLLFAVAALLCGTLAAQEVEWPADDEAIYKMAVKELKSKDNARVQDAINHLEDIAAVQAIIDDRHEKAQKLLIEFGQKPGIDNPIPVLLGKYDRVIERGFQKDGKSKWFIVGKEDDYGEKYQLVDGRGNALLQGTFNEIESCENGQFIVQIDDKKGIVSNDFKSLTPICYYNITYDGYSESSYIVRNSDTDGLVGVISQKGDLVVPTSYEDCNGAGHNAFLVTKPSGSFAVYFIDEKKEVGDFQQARCYGEDNIFLMVSNDKGFNGSKWAVFSPDERKVVSDYIFTLNPEDKEGMRIYNINLNGRGFYLITPYINGKIIGRDITDNSNAKLTLIDDHGNIVREITEFGDVEHYEPITGIDSKDARIAVTKCGFRDFGFVDLDFNLVIPCNYYNATNFFVDKSLATTPVALVKEGDEIKLINPNGNTLRTFSNEASLPASLKDVEWLEEEVIEELEPINEPDEYGKTAD